MIVTWHPAVGEPESSQLISLHLSLAQVVLNSDAQRASGVVVECSRVRALRQVTQAGHNPPTVMYDQTCGTVGTQSIDVDSHVKVVMSWSLELVGALGVGRQPVFWGRH